MKIRLKTSNAVEISSVAYGVPYIFKAGPIDELFMNVVHNERGLVDSNSAVPVLEIATGTIKNIPSDSLCHLVKAKIVSKGVK